MSPSAPMPGTASGEPRVFDHKSTSDGTPPAAKSSSPARSASLMALTAPSFAHFTSSLASPSCFARRSTRCWSRMIISGRKARPYCSATRISLGSAAAAASILEWPLPPERDEAVCAEMARCTDALLVRVARGRGALDVALGERLALLAVGDRALQLGYSGIGDYTREELGIAASTAQKMVRRARGLRDRPLFRAAVRSGEVTTRHAAAVLPAAGGEAEGAWVERA